MSAQLKLKRLIDKFIKDRNGKVVVWQTPNLPLASWFVFMLAARFVNADHLKNDFEFLSTALLFTWAYLELARGASIFRKLLGFVILLDIIASHIH